MARADRAPVEVGDSRYDGQMHTNAEARHRLYLDQAQQAGDIVLVKSTTGHLVEMVGRSLDDLRAEFRQRFVVVWDLLDRLDVCFECGIGSAFDRLIVRRQQCPIAVIENIELRSTLDFREKGLPFVQAHCSASEG